MTIVSPGDFVDYLRNLNMASDATLIVQAQAAAEQFVAQYCQRSFATTASSTSVRVYGPGQMRECNTVLRVHDFTDTASLVVVNNGTTVSSTGYQLEPLNGVDQTGFAVPYEQIRLVNSTWGTNGNQAVASITMKPGWTAVPSMVSMAVMLLGKDYIQYRDSTFGWLASGGVAMNAGRNWPAINALNPWRRVEAFGIA